MARRGLQGTLSIGPREPAGNFNQNRSITLYTRTTIYLSIRTHYKRWRRNNREYQNKEKIKKVKRIETVSIIYFMFCVQIIYRCVVCDLGS